jgi:hypothetical protein
MDDEEWRVILDWSLIMTVMTAAVNCYLNFRFTKWHLLLRYEITILKERGCNTMTLVQNELRFSRKWNEICAR